MGFSCKLGGGLSTEVIYLIEEGKALPPQFPGHHVGGILAVRGSPSQAKRQTDIYKNIALKCKKDKGPVTGIEGKLMISPG